MTSPHDKTRIICVRWEVMLLFLALTILVGCQGLSTGSKSTSTPPPQNNNSPGTLGVSTLTLDFSGVALGANKTLTLSATNNGATDITVSSITLSAPQFTLSKLTVPL